MERPPNKVNNSTKRPPPKADVPKRNGPPTPWLVKAFITASVVFVVLFFITFGAQQLLAAMGYVWFNAVVTMTEAVLNLALSITFVLVFEGVNGC